jgi:hypothetical protein
VEQLLQGFSDAVVVFYLVCCDDCGCMFRLVVGAATSLSKEELSFESKAKSARMISQGIRKNVASSYKYLTIHWHRGYNCTREIRYNVTFHLDTCINATLSERWIPRGNSFSFYYVSQGDADDDYEAGMENIFWMLGFADDGCTMEDNFGLNSGAKPMMLPSACRYGYRYTVSDELPTIPADASYIK